jgi:predicted RNA-binding Zn-ribbon protein involved in translation (DUF1610 family)
MEDVAISVLRGRRARQQEEPDSGIAIGDTDEIIPSCPACGRPLDSAAAVVCPGCGTRLLLGVQARKAGMFVAAGAVAGLLVGGLLIGGLASVTRPTVAPAAAAGGGSATDTSGGATSSGGAAPITIPSTSLAALRQTVTINQRMLADVPILETYVADKTPDAVAIAAALRAIAADAASGSDITTRIVFWKDAADLKAELQSFYAQVRSAAREGLAASMNNPKAYQAAARQMLVVLAGVSVIDARTQEVAARSGVAVPTALPAAD